MNENIRALRRACESLGLAFDELHASGNLLRVHTPGGDLLFANWSTPFNDQAVARVCEDKAYAHAVVSPHVHMPETLAFLDPDTHARYRHYREATSRREITGWIARMLALPVVVKRNRGSLGRNVFLCRDEREVRAAIDAIFDRSSAEYDYVCLAQPWVPHVREYRAVLVEADLVLAYWKDAAAATPSGNLSPLHSDGAVARRVDDPARLAALSAFCKPVHAALGISFCGLDVLEDAEGRLTLLEVNSAPGFDRYVAHNGNDDVVAVYRSALERRLDARQHRGS